MKIAQMWCLTAVLSLAGTAWTQAQTGGGTEKAIAALENKWLESYKTNNPDLIAPHLAEKFVNTATDGKTTGKAAALADQRATKFTSAEYDEVKVTVYGDTAIATGAFKGAGTDPKGKAFTDHSRWTDTWVKMPDGKWQCVASQDTSIQ